jgi:hypothetical protein
MGYYLKKIKKFYGYFFKEKEQLQFSQFGPKKFGWQKQK